MTSPLGNQIDNWITNCGSFECHGSFGGVDDLFTRVFLNSCSTSADSDFPDEIKMSREVYEFFIRSEMRREPVSPEMRGTLVEIISYLSRQEPKHLGLRPFYGAKASWGAEVPPGAALFYRRGELVGETSGWLP